jgi:hypothetical protein
MPLHRNTNNTPPPKPGHFMVFIYPQVVHSVVFTTNFFVSVVSICTTLTEKNQSHSPHTTETHITTMGVDDHGLYRRPWQSTAGSGATRVLATLWIVAGF